MLTYIVVITLFTYASPSPNKCCSDAENTVFDQKCAGGSELTGLPCNGDIFVNQRSPNLNFTTDEDDDLILYNIDEYEELDSLEIVDKDKYCLTILGDTKEEVALQCIENLQEIDDKGDIVLTIITICCIISIIFLLLTLAVYCFVKNLRTIQGKCIINSISALTVAFIMLNILQLAHIPRENCPVVGYLAYTSFLLSFSWLNVVSFHIWMKSVFTDIPLTMKKWYLIYCCYGYGIPLILLIIVVVLDHSDGVELKPGIAQACFFITNQTIWIYFYGPITVAIIINIMLFAFTVRALYAQIGESSANSRTRTLQYMVRMYFKLLLVMGITWIFEVLSVAVQQTTDALDILWNITDIMNSLQGVLIFVVLVVLRKRALRGLAKRRPCGIRFPESWKTLMDIEYELTQEEIELSLSTKPDVPTQV